MIVSTPYSSDKNLGKAYNKFFNLLPSGEWGCVRDLDTCFLTPSSIMVIEKYVKLFPETGIFTCYTNRVGYLPGVYKTNQVYQDRVDENSNMLDHIQIAQKLEGGELTVTEIDNVISGMLMVVKKEIWELVGGFPDGLLGIDNEFSKKVLDLGMKIYRMDNVYIWHTYRIWKNIRDKSHL
jgi:GT2 family glycosyltransferase